MSDDLIKAILAKYELDYKTVTWPVPGGKARAIYHKTLEQLAAKADIGFAPPDVISSDPENIAVVVKGYFREEKGTVQGTLRREEWSFGEASPKNNRNAYPWAMAEKRAKDRVILKLLGLHGALYSEDEAEELKPKVEVRPRVAQAFLDHPEHKLKVGSVARTLAASLEETIKERILKCETPTELSGYLKNEKTVEALASLTDAQREFLRSYAKSRLNALRIAYPKVLPDNPKDIH
jgi:hypothetical protein